MKKILFLFCFACVFVAAPGQLLPDHIYKPNIHTTKLYKQGDIYSYPIIALNSGEQLELHFDDMDANVKSYYYTYQLCNADWSPSNLPGFDYIRGFQTNRITNYRNSSVAFTRYTHYQANFPERSMIPTRSGNYLLKVFLNSDTSALCFTKRFLVVDNKVSIAAQVRQPFSSQYFLTDQRIQLTVSTAQARINIMSPQDLKVAVLQNNIWPTSALLTRPSVYRGNYFEYNDDASSFQAGREWRWIDLRSLRLMSDRMQKLIDTNDDRTEVIVKPDAERKQQIYVYYRDLNGIYTVENTDGYNPWWQSDYAYVRFTYVPPGGRAYPGREIYVFGELTNYLPDNSSRMEFNTEKGVYEKTLYLKQGYYNYSYVTLEAGRNPGNRFSFDNTEGNFTNTENGYTVLVYFRPFGARADELIGIAQLNTLAGR
jgi:Domain of unknown function (DUF5103)